MPRHGHAGFNLGGCLCVCGASMGQGDVLTSAERLNPATGIWTPLAPWSTPRLRPAAAVVAGQLYVSGGYTVAPAFGVPLPNEALLDGVERLDTEGHFWGPRPPPPTSRCGAAAGALAA